MENSVLKSQKEDRIIGIDLLKILSMIMIVALHIIGNFRILGNIDSIPHIIVPFYIFRQDAPSTVTLSQAVFYW